MIHRLHCSSHAINFHFHLLSRCPCPCPCPCQTISQSVTRHSQFIWALSSKSHHYISSLPIPTKTSLCPTKPTLSRLSLCVTIDPSSPPSLTTGQCSEVHLAARLHSRQDIGTLFSIDFTNHTPSLKQTRRTHQHHHPQLRVTPTAFDWISHALNPPPTRRLANKHTHQ